MDDDRVVRRDPMRWAGGIVVFLLSMKDSLQRS